MRTNKLQLLSGGCWWLRCSVNADTANAVASCGPELQCTGGDFAGAMEQPQQRRLLHKTALRAKLSSNWLAIQHALRQSQKSTVLCRSSKDLSECPQVALGH